MDYAQRRNELEKLIRECNETAGGQEVMKNWANHMKNPNYGKYTGKFHPVNTNLNTLFTHSDSSDTEDGIQPPIKRPLPTQTQPEEMIPIPDFPTSASPTPTKENCSGPSELLLPNSTAQLTLDGTQDGSFTSTVLQSSQYPLPAGNGSVIKKRLFPNTPHDDVQPMDTIVEKTPGPQSPPERDDSSVRRRRYTARKSISTTKKSGHTSIHNMQGSVITMNLQPSPHHASTLLTDSSNKKKYSPELTQSIVTLSLQKNTTEEPTETSPKSNLEIPVNKMYSGDTSFASQRLQRLKSRLDEISSLSPMGNTTVPNMGNRKKQLFNGSSHSPAKKAPTSQNKPSTSQNIERITQEDSETYQSSQQVIEVMDSDAEEGSFVVETLTTDHDIQKLDNTMKETSPRKEPDKNTSEATVVLNETDNDDVVAEKSKRKSPQRKNKEDLIPRTKPTQNQKNKSRTTNIQSDSDSDENAVVEPQKKQRKPRGKAKANTSEIEPDSNLQGKPQAKRKTKSQVTVTQVDTDNENGLNKLQESCKLSPVAKKYVKKRSKHRTIIESESDSENEGNLAEAPKKSQQNSQISLKKLVKNTKRRTVIQSDTDTDNQFGQKGTKKTKEKRSNNKSSVVTVQSEDENQTNEPTKGRGKSKTTGKRSSKVQPKKKTNRSQPKSNSRIVDSSHSNEENVDNDNPKWKQQKSTSKTILASDSESDHVSSNESESESKHDITVVEMIAENIPQKSRGKRKSKARRLDSESDDEPERDKLIALKKQKVAVKSKKAISAKDNAKRKQSQSITEPSDSSAVDKPVKRPAGKTNKAANIRGAPEPDRPRKKTTKKTSTRALTSEEGAAKPKGNRRRMRQQSEEEREKEEQELDVSPKKQRRLLKEKSQQHSSVRQWLSSEDTGPSKRIPVNRANVSKLLPVLSAVHNTLHTPASPDKTFDPFKMPITDPTILLKSGPVKERTVFVGRNMQPPPSPYEDSFAELPNVDQSTITNLNDSRDKRKKIMGPPASTPRVPTRNKHFFENPGQPRMPVTTVESDSDSEALEDEVEPQLSDGDTYAETDSQHNVTLVDKRKRQPPKDKRKRTSKTVNTQKKSSNRTKNSHATEVEQSDDQARKSKKEKEKKTKKSKQKDSSIDKPEETSKKSNSQIQSKGNLEQSPVSSTRHQKRGKLLFKDPTENQQSMDNIDDRDSHLEERNMSSDHEKVEDQEVTSKKLTRNKARFVKQAGKGRLEHMKCAAATLLFVDVVPASLVKPKVKETEEVRRSSRVRSRPLNRWCGEDYQYDADGNIIGILHPDFLNEARNNSLERAMESNSEKARSKKGRKKKNKSAERVTNSQSNLSEAQHHSSRLSNGVEDETADSNNLNKEGRRTRSKERNPKTKPTKTTKPQKGRRKNKDSNVPAMEHHSQIASSQQDDTTTTNHDEIQIETVDDTEQLNDARTRSRERSSKTTSKNAKSQKGRRKNNKSSNVSALSSQASSSQQYDTTSNHGDIQLETVDETEHLSDVQEQSMEVSAGKTKRTKSPSRKNKKNKPAANDNNLSNRNKEKRNTTLNSRNTRNITKDPLMTPRDVTDFDLESLKSTDICTTAGELNKTKFQILDQTASVVISGKRLVAVDDSQDSISHPSDGEAHMWFSKGISNSQCSMGTMTLLPGHEKGLGCMKNTLSFFVIRGLISLVIGGTTVKLQGGNYFIVPAGNPYNVANLSQSEQAVLGFHQLKLKAKHEMFK